MGTLDKRICNVETAVSSIPWIHVSLVDVLASLANLDKKLDSRPQVDDETVIAVNEIRHELNIVIECSSAANSKGLQTIDFCNQEDHISSQDFTNDEYGDRLPAAPKTTKETLKKKNSNSTSCSYYSKGCRYVKQQTGTRIPHYHQPY